MVYKISKKTRIINKKHGKNPLSEVKDEEVKKRKNRE